MKSCHTNPSYIRLVLLSILLLCVLVVPARQNPARKPQYVTIINDEIVTKETVNEYAKNGDIKQMTKGVSEEQRNKLAEKFGDKIGDKEFIILISIYTEAEKKEKEAGGKNQPVTQDSAGKQGAEYFETNEPAKDFTVEMLDHTTQRLADLKGKVVLLNFWATWCGPCLMEFYEMPTKVLDPFKNSLFVFLPVSKGESSEKVAAKMARLGKDGIRFPVALDPDGTVASLYDAAAIPKNILIDKKGMIRFVSVGNQEGNLDRLAMQIRKLLDE